MVGGPDVKMETNEKKAVAPSAPPDGHRSTGPLESCLFARTPEGITVGVVTHLEPSPLALLAAGVAGMAARRARSGQTKPLSNLAGT